MSWLEFCGGSFFWVVSLESFLVGSFVVGEFGFRGSSIIRAPLTRRKAGGFGGGCDLGHAVRAENQARASIVSPFRRLRAGPNFRESSRRLRWMEFNFVGNTFLAYAYVFTIAGACKS